MPDTNTSDNSATGSTTGTTGSTSTDSTTTDAQQTTTEPSGQGDPGALGDAGKAALAAERTAKANAEKRARAAEAKLKAIEDRDMSELEKAKRDAAEARTLLETSQRNEIRLRVATAKGVPADLVDRLMGDTEDELSADADKLLALVKGTAAASPKPDRSQGASQDMALNGDPLLRDLMAKVGARPAQ